MKIGSLFHTTHNALPDRAFHKCVQSIHRVQVFTEKRSIRIFTSLRSHHYITLAKRVIALKIALHFLQFDKKLRIKYLFISSINTMNLPETKCCAPVLLYEAPHFWHALCCQFFVVSRKNHSWPDVDKHTKIG